MKRILTCNVQKDYNFGGPCLLFGIRELLDNIYGDDYIVENIQAGYEEQVIEDGIPIKTSYFYPMSKRFFLRFLFGYGNCMGLFSLLKYISKFDVVIDLFGICFCDNLDKGRHSKLKNRLRDFKKYTVSILAKKILKKKVIKNTASFGPMEEEYNRDSAFFMCTQIYDEISAREKESQLTLQKNILFSRKVRLSPDTANLMPFIPDEKSHNEIILSVSHMMKKQWKAGEDYILCMAKFVRHIVCDLELNVAILPNECNPSYYNDVNVSKEIYLKVQDLSDEVRIIDVKNLKCSAVKNEIASAYILVGSRYHSCVAALSAGVPCLIIGWHDKYEELLRNYGQEEWLLSNLDCSYEKLANKFEDLVKRYNQEKSIINDRIVLVKNAIIEVGRELYGEGID